MNELLSCPVSSGDKEKEESGEGAQVSSCHIEKAQELKALPSYNSQFPSSERNKSQVDPGLLVQTQNTGAAWSYPQPLPGEISR